MRIAIFSDNFYPEISGISDSIIKLAEGLAGLNHDICFFAPKYSKANYGMIKRPATELELGEKIKNKTFFFLAVSVANQAGSLSCPLPGTRFKRKKI